MSTDPDATVCLHLPFHDRRRADRAVVLCDADCWAHLSKYHWVVTTDDEGRPSYVVCDPHGRFPRSLHRECYAFRHGGTAPAGRLVDHINRVRTDCRAANLRACDASQSACNRGKALKRKGRAPTSAYKGVWRKKRRVLKSGAEKVEKKPWVCEVSVKDQDKKHTSCHNTEEEAARKYNEVAREWMGEFAVLNTIVEPAPAAPVAPADAPSSVNA